MGIADGLSKARMLEIEGNSIVDGLVDGGGNLILTRHDGSNVSAGHVKGDPGGKGDPGSSVDLSTPWYAGTTYKAGDVVGYGGKMWKAYTTNLGMAPSYNTTAWIPVTGADSGDWSMRDPHFLGSDVDRSYEIYWGTGTRSFELTSAAGEYESGHQALKLIMGAASSSWVGGLEENYVGLDERIEISWRAKASVVDAGVTLRGFITQNTRENRPTPYTPGSTNTESTEGQQKLTTEWKTYRAVVHTVVDKPRARFVLLAQSDNIDTTIFVDWIKVSRTNNVDHVGRVLQRAQSLISGGGRRQTTSTGISWSSRFIVMGMGNSKSGAQSGYFDIVMPPNGTVIPIYGGNTSSSTVASGKIPMANWDALYYELPIGEPFDNGPSRYKIVQFNWPFQIPANWILVCYRTGDHATNPMYMWGDGMRQDYWRNFTLTSSWVPYHTAGNGFPIPGWRIEHDGKVRTRGLMKGGLSGTSNPFASVDPDLAPAGNPPISGSVLIALSASGSARIDAFPDGNLAVVGYGTGGSNGYVSLDNLSWYPSGT